LILVREDWPDGEIGIVRSRANGTKIRVEATVARDLYDKIRAIIVVEQKQDADKDWPELSVSNVVEMLLKKGVRAYYEAKIQRHSNELAVGTTRQASSLRQ